MPARDKNISWIHHHRSAGGVVFGEVLYHPGGTHGPRVQLDFQLVLVHSGSAVVELAEARHEMLPGAVTLLCPGGREYFRFSSEAPTHHSWCSVHPRLVGNELAGHLRKAPRALPLTGVMRHLHDAAFETEVPRSPADRRLLERLGLLLLEEYARTSQGGGSPSMAPAARARRYIHEHFGEATCLRDAARHAGVSAPYLVACFRRAYETTPGRYLWQVRVERGAALVMESGLTFSEIADRCGFANPFHFSRMVRRAQGMPPRALRQRAWAGKAPAGGWPGAGANVSCRPAL